MPTLIYATREYLKQFIHNIPYNQASSSLFAFIENNPSFEIHDCLEVINEFYIQILPRYFREISDCIHYDPQAQDLFVLCMDFVFHIGHLRQLYGKTFGQYRLFIDSEINQEKCDKVKQQMRDLICDWLNNRGATVETLSAAMSLFE